jgi:hypothetical protein
MIDKDTKRIISISRKPSTFGVDFHNAGYKELGLNYVYLPLEVKPPQLETVAELIRNNFHGCSVSMPHKQKIIKYLDQLYTKYDLARHSDKPTIIIAKTKKGKGVSFMEADPLKWHGNPIDEKSYSRAREELK